MKKVTFFIIMIVSTLLCSCGTTANYASADSWEDGIYYRKSQERTQEIFTDNKEIEDLVHKTKEEARRYTETIIISDAVSEQDSTLNRQYEINLNFYEDPWQDSYYSYNSWMYWGPSWSLYWDPFWYPSYWGPSWGWGFHYGYYGWYAPWYSPWYDPWYYYPVYPVYPFYPQYAVNDGPVVYGKRESGRSSSLSSSVQRGNLLTSNKELGEQLIIDIAKYKTHPNCKILYRFVFDPEGYIQNPRGLENDLTKEHEGLDVKVYIRPI